MKDFFLFLRRRDYYLKDSLDLGTTNHNRCTYRYNRKNKKRM